MKKYAICTLVTNFEQYNHMKQSFLNSGFDSECDYFLLDNSILNTYDGYSGINYFIQNIEAKYLIVCHQDVEINFDNREKLDEVIANMDKIDAFWGVLGNAGGDNDMSKLYLNLNDIYKSKKIMHFPKKVFSLDENFLVINNKYNISCSHDLFGFHFYGTDLCLQALFKGCNSYVIDFYLTHHGKGTIDKEFFQAKDRFIRKYSQIFNVTYIRTTCAKLYFSNSRLKRQIFNNSFMMKIKTLLDIIRGFLSDR